MLVRNLNVKPIVLMYLTWQSQKMSFGDKDEGVSTPNFGLMKANMPNNAISLIFDFPRMLLFELNLRVFPFFFSKDATHFLDFLSWHPHI